VDGITVGYLITLIALTVFFVDTGTRQFFSSDARKVFLPDFITAG